MELFTYAVNKKLVTYTQTGKQNKSFEKTIALLLIDIEKAFDAVWHNGLLKKLDHQKLSLLSPVASFLTD